MLLPERYYPHSVVGPFRSAADRNRFRVTDSLQVVLDKPCWKVQSGLLSNERHPDLTRRSRVRSG